MATHKKHQAGAITQALAVAPQLHAPEPTLVAKNRDEVTKSVAAISARLSDLGERYGVTWSAFNLDEEIPSPAEIAKAAPTDASLGEFLVVTFLAGMARAFLDREYVTVERIDGEWGVFYLRTPAPRTGGEAATRWVLAEAPFDVREKFLRRSSVFVTQYLERVGKVRERMEASVSAGSKTLELLNRFEQV